MNHPRCSDLDYIHFLIAAQKAFTCTEAARCQPEKPLSPAHDAFTRLLKGQPPDTGALWNIKTLRGWRRFGLKKPTKKQIIGACVVGYKKAEPLIVEALATYLGVSRVTIERAIQTR
jgi:hypothetical protein